MRSERKRTIRPCLKMAACEPMGILPQFCLAADSSKTNRRIESQTDEPDRIVRSRHMKVTLFRLAPPISVIKIGVGMNQKTTDAGQTQTRAVLPQNRRQSEISNTQCLRNFNNAPWPSFLTQKKDWNPPTLHNPQCDYLTLTRLRDKRIRKAGPNFLMFTSGGNSASVAVPKTFAKIKSSPSGTRRCLVSSFASDSRLTSHPKTCNFADNSSCVQPLRSRNSRTCGPIRFSGDETLLMAAKLAVSCRNIVRLRSQIRLVKWQPLSQSSARNPEGGHTRVIRMSTLIILGLGQFVESKRATLFRQYLFERFYARRKQYRFNQKRK